MDSRKEHRAVRGRRTQNPIRFHLPGAGLVHCRVCAFMLSLWLSDLVPVSFLSLVDTHMTKPTSQGLPPPM